MRRENSASNILQIFRSRDIDMRKEHLLQWLTVYSDVDVALAHFVNKITEVGQQTDPDYVDKDCSAPEHSIGFSLAS